MQITVVASGISFSKLFPFVFSLFYTVFLTTCLLTTSLIFFKSAVFYLSTSKSYDLVFKLFKPVGALNNLLTSSLLTSAFRAMKSFSTAKLDISTPVTSSNYFLEA